MTLKVRSVLVIVVGTLLGLTVSLGAHIMSGYDEDRNQRLVDTQADPAAQIAAVIERVRREYVEPLDEEALVQSAIRGIVSELDNHSRFLDSVAYEDIRISTYGNYSGVGLDLSIDDGKVVVVAPIEDAPAQRAGILPGDIVVAVDGIAVGEENISETVSLMRGRPGTPVTIDVLREGVNEPLGFALTRSSIVVHSVSGELVGDDVAYVRLSGFSDTTTADLRAEAASLQRLAGGHLSGFVLDLRDNPGGVLDAAVGVADSFLEEGLIVRGAGRHPEARFVEMAEAGDALESVPLVILVNGRSASASEIVAGALRDHGRARLVGERTYGKGSVQTLLPLGDDSAIKLTTSRYILPSGRSINGRGIEPDILVEAGHDSRRLYRGARSGVQMPDDPQLVSALRLLGAEPLTVSRAP